MTENTSAEITGRITGIKYDFRFTDGISIERIETSSDFDINKLPTTFILNYADYSFAISKWVSPKRTRSYPYERVYNTLKFGNRVAVIPVVKDEGNKGDRDFIQWDTISLMSLLNVFVIFAYYDAANRKSGKEGKITDQKFNNGFVVGKIETIKNYHSSALHWNLNELNENLSAIFEKAKTSYDAIARSTGVELHATDEIVRRKRLIEKDVSKFMEFSRDKAEQAQSREVETVQPKESLSSLTKAKITITNYLGGRYFFTVDEVKFESGKLFLTEAKHTKRGLLPSIGDIKDGLLKVILYCNLSEVKINGKKADCQAVLELTSSKLNGQINSAASKESVTDFFGKNRFRQKEKDRVETLFKEAQANNFLVKIQKRDD